MALKVAFQMDPIEPVDIDADSSFVLALEAQERGHQLFHYLPQDLSFRDGKVVAEMRTMELRREYGNHCTMGEAKTVDVADMDVVWLRQDPPFDMSYLSTTYLLELVHPKTLVVNNPTEVRNAPEKLSITHFSHLLPPTLITRNVAEIKAFREEHKDIIVKPLFGNGGEGVFHLKPGDENLGSLLEMFFARSRDPLMIQRYVPEIVHGDKRIIIVDGEPIGGINRIPEAGEARANMHAGGKVEKVGLTDREIAICDELRPFLKERGMIFVGIDVIGDYMTEINVTSPTGLQELRKFDGTNGEGLIWDAIERKYAETR